MKPVRPQRARYKKIEQLVARLLADAGVLEPAVPIEKIAKRFGAEVKYGDLDDVSGLLIRHNSSAVIGVNKKQAKVRQRFTIAHELGHLLLHEEISSHFDRDFKVHFRSEISSQATDVEEIEANFFAASVLMPRYFLDSDNALDALDSDQAVANLATRYDVSRHAMSLRLANLYNRHVPF